jgi:hypothetical protein
MTATLTRLVGRHRDVVIGAVSWLLAMAIIAPAIRTPAHIDRRVIDNPHPWLATVSVSGGEDRDGWLPLGIAQRERQHEFVLVTDQGDTWSIRFSYARQHVDLLVRRAQLQRDDWHVTVPDDFAAQLRAAGVAETPERST